MLERFSQCFFFFFLVVLNAISIKDTTFHYVFNICFYTKHIANCAFSCWHGIDNVYMNLWPRSPQPTSEWIRFFFSYQIHIFTSLANKARDQNSTLRTITTIKKIKKKKPKQCWAQEQWKIKTRNERTTK